MESRRITRRTTADLAVSLGKTAAQITAQFAPVPALGPATEVLCGIIQLCQNVAQNRCEKPVVNESITAAIDSVTQCVRGIQNKNPANLKLNRRCLEQILAKMKEWTQMNKIQGFLHQTEIAKDIDRCHWMISDCLDRFQPISQPEIQDWKPQFKLDTEEDHRELMSYLANIENSQTITKDALSQGNEIQKIMAMMQQLMGENLGMANQQHNGLPSNLYDLQLKSGELLPEMHLRAGEVVRIGQFPISGTSAMDIYEGLYLGREKVAIKVVRAVNSNENSLRRFKRECDIWKQLWQIDRGQHILPFYGFCQEDGPFPYMVSPWQPNGTALTFVENGQDKIDYVKLVKGVALGLQVLHSINPPVVHGDLRASNIVIDITGNPLIADFGLSRIVEDITGIPFSQSRGVSDAYRWCAPEICIGQGVFTLGSDVYAYGMTVLEIFTHEQPYNNIKNTTEVVIRSAKGEHPPQPTDPKVVRRGLDDQMWALLSLCWITDPSLRPTIQQVLEGLETGEPIKLPSGASSSEADSRELGTSPPTNEASQTTTNDALQVRVAVFRGCVCHYY
ncbi:kinase-like domain-containing protein [Mycena galopus ATCC 62051]|nr:kinase-like domain-containing protein [Mycena galopus ATCC 62051]